MSEINRMINSIEIHRDISVFDSYFHCYKLIVKILFETYHEFDISGERKILIISKFLTF